MTQTTGKELMKAGRLFLAGALAVAALSLLPAGASAAGQISITAGPAEGATIPGPTATFEFQASGLPAVGYFCTVDGGKEFSCGSPFTTEALADGSHSFTVFAREGGTLNQTDTLVRNFKVAKPVIGGGVNQPWIVNTSAIRMSKSGKFDIEVSCPATATLDCTGTLRARTDCCSAGAGYNNLKVASVVVSGTPGGTATKSLFTRAGSSASRPGPAKKKHIANVKWSDAAISAAPGQTVTVGYKAKKGKTGSAKSAFAAKKSRRGKKSGSFRSIKRIETAIEQPGVPTAYATHEVAHVVQQGPPPTQK